MSSRTSGRSGAEVPNCMQPTCDAYQWMKGKGLREGRTASVRPRPWPIIGPLPSGSIVLPLGNIMTGPTDITVLLWQGYYHSVTYSGYYHSIRISAEYRFRWIWKIPISVNHSQTNGTTDRPMRMRRLEEASKHFEIDHLLIRRLQVRCIQSCHTETLFKAFSMWYFIS